MIEKLLFPAPLGLSALAVGGISVIVAPLLTPGATGRLKLRSVLDMPSTNHRLVHVAPCLRDGPDAARAVIQGTHALQITARPCQSVLDLCPRSVPVQHGLLRLRERLAFEHLRVELFDCSRVAEGNHCP